MGPRILLGSSPCAGLHTVDHTIHPPIKELLSSTGTGLTSLQISASKAARILVHAITPEIRACNFIKKETPTQSFSCEFSEIFKNNFFNRTPPVAASG